MNLVNDALTVIGCLPKFQRLENRGFFNTVDDVVNPTAQGVDGVDGSTLVKVQCALNEE